MRKTVNTTIDHFNVAVPDPARATEITRRLGFVCGDLPTDILQHFMFDNSYFEFCSNGFDVYFPKVGLAKKAQEGAEIGSILLSGRDADEARQLYVDAGFDVTECYIANRWANHGTRQGQATFKAFLIRDFAPYKTNHIFGHSVHLTPELIFPEERFLHTNHVAEMESLVFVTNDVDACAEEIQKLDEITKKVAIPGHYIRFATLMDAEDHKAEFGVDIETSSEIKSAAVVFAGGDKSYVKVCADSAGLNNFYKEDKLFVDLRGSVGLFYIFK